MDERKILFPYSTQLFFTALIQALKEIKIPYEYFQEDDGEYWAFTEFFTTHANGATLAECERELIKDFRVWAQIYMKDFEKNIKEDAFSLPYVFKVLSSTDEELQSCLTGKICEDI